ncbi:MAG: hypothetical protein ACLFPA_06095 [Dichotomicrobium sp.]
MQNALKAFVLLAAGLAAFVFVTPQASAATAGAAPMSLKGAVADTALGAFVEHVQYRRRHRIRRFCRRRFGRGPRYRRCLRRRGFYGRRRGIRRRCRRVRIQCRRRFGYGRNYRRCVVRRGCR